MPLDGDGATRRARDARGVRDVPARRRATARRRRDDDDDAGDDVSTRRADARGRAVRHARDAARDAGVRPLARARARVDDATRPTRRGGLADVACEGVRAATSWDGEHHVGIAVRGYEFEHQHAFYPGLAMATRATTRAVRRAARAGGGGTTRDDARAECAAGAAAVAINAYAFARSVEAMYALSTELLRDEALAEAAATLYAMNPANVFYGSAYAEAGFAYAQFAAGSLLQENKVLHSGVLFGVATMFRSNGVLCVVLLLGHAGREMFRLLRDANDETRHRRAARHLKRAMIAIALDRRAALRVRSFRGHAILQRRRIRRRGATVLSPKVVAQPVRIRSERDVFFHSEALLESRLHVVLSRAKPRERLARRARHRARVLPHEALCLVARRARLRQGGAALLRRRVLRQTRGDDRHSGDVHARASRHAIFEHLAGDVLGSGPPRSPQQSVETLHRDVPRLLRPRRRRALRQFLPVDVIVTDTMYHHHSRIAL